MMAGQLHELRQLSRTPDNVEENWLDEYPFWHSRC